MNQDQLQKNIMRRVYYVHYLKKACSTTACKCYALMVMFVALASTVSIANVIANMPRTWDLMYHYDFTMYAFERTEFFVQLLLIGITAMALWMGFDMLRNIRYTPSLKRAEA